jgi:DNA-binding NarL/FixJ family response regulator
MMIRLAVIDSHVKESEHCIHSIESEGMVHQVTTSEFKPSTIEEKNKNDNLIVVLNVKLSTEEGKVLLSQIESQQAKVCLYISLTSDALSGESSTQGVLTSADWILLDKGTRNTLVDELDNIFNKGKRIAPRIASRLLRFITHPEFKTWNLSEVLTSREAEILSLTAEGHSNKAIATTLGISLNTVKNHNRRIFQKIGATHRSEAIKKYLNLATEA